jgi:hypothetical protein
MLHHNTLDVSYRQFYVEDINSDADTGHIWDHPLDDPLNGYALGTLPNTIAVGTRRWGGDIDVDIELLDQRPTIDYNEWDHIAECSLDVPSGRIRTYGCLSDPDTTPTLDLPPGTYRVLIYYGGFDTVDENDGAGLTGDDHYRVTLWPGTFTEPRMVK